MKSSNQVKPKSTIPYLITDVIVFLVLGFAIVTVDYCWIKRARLPDISDAALISVGTILALCGLFGFIFYLIVEYKFNRLKLKNIFFYLGIVIAIGNLIAVASLPSEMSLPNDTSLIITPLMRFYYIVSGFFYALLPALCFYLIPRKITSRHYLDVILYIVIGVTVASIILSFITDWDHYIHYLDNPTGIDSIFMHKNAFGLMLVTGMFASVILRIRHHNAKWSLFLIPFYIFLVLSLAKIALLIGTLMLLIYVVTEIILLAKKSKDNLIITLLIVGFFVIITPLFIVGLIRCDDGLLFKIKQFFIDLGNSAQTTFSSRLLIWESSFKLLASWRVIFGYGVDAFGLAMHQVYTPIAPDFDKNIFTPHNFVIQLLGNGGIILLAVYIFLYAYLIYVMFKLRNKKNHWWIDATLIFLFFFTFLGMFEDSNLCGLLTDFIPSGVIISLVMSEYYLTIDKDEKKIREDIVKTASKIKKVSFKSKIDNLNKKRLIYEAKYIAYDLNSKIKL